MAQRFFAPLVLAALCAPACASHAVPGFVSVTPEGQMRLYFAAPLPADQPVFIQTPAADSKGKPRCCTRLAPDAVQPITTPQERVSSVAGTPVFSYAVKPPSSPQSWGENGFVGIAMSAPKATRSGGYAVVGHNRDRVTRARLCFGTEGLNLISSARDKISALYLAFGYEVDESPKCNSQDLRDLEQVSD